MVDLTRERPFQRIEKGRGGAAIIGAAIRGEFNRVKKLIPGTEQSDIREAFREALNHRRPQVLKALMKHAGDCIPDIDIANAKEEAGNEARKIRKKIRDVDSESSEYEALDRQLTKIESIEEHAELVLLRRMAKRLEQGQIRPVAEQDQITLDFGQGM